MEVKNKHRKYKEVECSSFTVRRYDDTLDYELRGDVFGESLVVSVVTMSDLVEALRAITEDDGKQLTTKK